MPITTLNFIQNGDDVVFETVLNFGLEIVDVDEFQDGDTDVYVFEFDDNRTERIEIK